MAGVTDDRIIEEVVSRVGRSFPRLTRESLAGLVQENLKAFSDAKIRDFLPVLVERRLVQSLKPGTPSPTT